MTNHINPFVRGYDSFSIKRLLMITYEAEFPAAYLPLHPSQAQLTDADVQQRRCIFCDNFALVIEGQVISDGLDAQCTTGGLVRAVIYEITAQSFGTLVHVGDQYSLESAQQVIQQLTFETGHYSRCWEISSAHLSNQAMQYLADLADSDEPTGLMFETFRVPGCFAFACKLYCTPWTDQNLAAIDDSTATQLREEQLRAGVPESLLDVLHLAALADTRFLIFDPDATVLNGLPISGE